MYGEKAKVFWWIEDGRILLFCEDSPDVDAILQEVLQKFHLGEGFDLVDIKTGKRVGDIFSFLEGWVQEEFPWIFLEWVEEDPRTLKKEV